MAPLRTEKAGPAGGSAERPLCNSPRAQPRGAGGSPRQSLRGRVVRRPRSELRTAANGPRRTESIALGRPRGLVVVLRLPMQPARLAKGRQPAQLGGASRLATRKPKLAHVGTKY